MKKLRVSNIAQRDLEDIWSFVANQSRSAEIADGVVDSITGVFPLLDREPEAGTRRDQIAEGLRGFPVNTYVIYYREIGPYIVISRIIHSSRDHRTAYSQG